MADDGLSRCEALLRERSDEKRFVGLLLASKLMSSPSHLARIFPAALPFLRRLLASPPPPGADANPYQGVAFSVLACFASEPSLGARPELLGCTAAAALPFLPPDPPACLSDAVSVLRVCLSHPGGKEEAVRGKIASGVLAPAAARPSYVSRHKVGGGEKGRGREGEREREDVEAEDDGEGAGEKEEQKNKTDGKARDTVKEREERGNGEVSDGGCGGGGDDQGVCETPDEGGTARTMGLESAEEGKNAGGREGEEDSEGPPAREVGRGGEDGSVGPPAGELACELLERFAGCEAEGCGADLICELFDSTLTLTLALSSQRDDLTFHRLRAALSLLRALRALPSPRSPPSHPSHPSPTSPPSLLSPSQASRLGVALFHAMGALLSSRLPPYARSNALQAVEIANQLCGPSWLIGASDFVRREKLEEEKGGGEAEGGKDGAVAGSGAQAQQESESMFKGKHRKRDAGDKEERRAAKGGEVTGVAGGVAEGGEGGRERGGDGGAEPSEGEGGRLLALVIQLASVELQMALYDQPADTTPECEAVLPACCQILEEALFRLHSDEGEGCGEAWLDALSDEQLLSSQRAFLSSVKSGLDFAEALRAEEARGTAIQHPLLLPIARLLSGWMAQPSAPDSAEMYDRAISILPFLRDATATEAAAGWVEHLRSHERMPANSDALPKVAGEREPPSDETMAELFSRLLPRDQEAQAAMMAQWPHPGKPA